MDQVRCLHRKRNKIQYFSTLLVNNAHWRKQTGWEPAPLPEITDPVTTTEPNEDELHVVPVVRRKRGPNKKKQTA